MPPSDAITVDTDDTTLTRAPRQETERRPSSDTAPVVEDGVISDDHDPTVMLAQSQRAVERAQQEAASARNAAAQAQNEAARARDAAARAQMDRAGEHAAFVATAVNKATSDLDAARTAKRTAREAGDLDAEIAADERLASARYALDQANAELSHIQTAADRNRGGAPRQDQAGGGDNLSQQARQWITDHPRYNSDRRYRVTAQDAHAEAIERGISADSPAYFDHINQALTEVFGDEHDGAATRGNGMAGGPRDFTSAGGSTNRGGGGSAASSANTVQTGMGPVRVQQQGNGKMTITLPPPGSEARRDWEEAATINEMTLGQYAYEQVKIAREMQAGGNANWTRGDGETHR